MAELTELVLSGKIDVEILLDWITGKLSEDETPVEICNHLDWKNVFVLHLLNFIHEQGSHILCTSKDFGPSNLHTYSSPSKKKAERANELRRWQKNSSSSKPIRTLFPESDEHKQRTKHNRSISGHTPRQLNLGDFIPLSDIQDRERQRSQSLKLDTKSGCIPDSSKKRIKPISVKSPENDEAFRSFGEGKVNEQQRNMPVVSPTIALPSLELVTDRNKLDALATLYGQSIKLSLVPSVAVELKFVMQLLVVQCDSDTSNSLLSTVSNAIYFACRILDTIRCLIKYLHPSHKQILAENAHVVKFAPEELIQYLSEPDLELSCPVNIASEQSVPFSTDTDSRINFPSERSFRSFCKQRDGFYEIVRTWQTHQMRPGWSLTSLESRIQRTIDMHPDAANYMHLARLFVSQLIAMCQADEPEVPNEPQGFQGSYSDRLKRLNERLISTPSKVTFLLSDFLGNQEFFQDFLLVGSNPTLNEHVKTCIASLITEETFGPSEVADIRSEFAFAVIRLRLLGKFLGFLHFLPYRTESVRLITVPEMQVCIRTSVPPILDVVAILDAAARERRLVLTIPMLVEFLCQMDPVAPHLPVYRSALISLMHLYRSLPCGCSDSQWMNSKNAFLLRIMLGRLFAAPFMPESILCEPCVPFIVESPTDESLDSHDLVGTDLLYNCCPHLWKLKSPLSELGELTQQSEIRHITPVATSSQPSPQDFLQSHLEDNFFRNQPASVKKTVEFVSERVASNIVKHIRANIVAPAQRAVMKESPQELYLSCLQSCHTYIHQNCRTDTNRVVLLLLPSDFPVTALTACTDIAVRECERKCLHWAQMHVTQLLFEREYELAVKLQSRSGRSGRATTPKRREEITHDPHCMIPSKVLQMVKEVLRKVIWEGSNVNSDMVTRVVTNVMETVKGREDLLPLPEAGLGSLTAELAVALAIFSPEALTSEVQVQFVDLWTKNLQLTTFPQGVISPRNLHLISTSSQQASSIWNRIESLLSQLIRSELVSPESFQDQCLQIMRSEWEPTLLKRFAACVQSIVDSCLRDGKVNQDEFVQVMEWIVWFCAENEED